MCDHELTQRRILTLEKKVFFSSVKMRLLWVILWSHMPSGLFWWESNAMKRIIPSWMHKERVAVTFIFFLQIDVAFGEFRPYEGEKIQATGNLTMFDCIYQLLKIWLNVTYSRHIRILTLFIPSENWGGIKDSGLLVAGPAFTIVRCWV